MNKHVLLVLGMFFCCCAAFAQRAWTVNMPPQGLTDHQIFPVSERVAIRLSDTAGTGIPSELYRVIVQQNPGIRLNRLYYFSTGQKGNSGYGLYCPTLRLLGNMLTVTIQESKPKSGNFYADIVTYPGLWMRTPKNWNVKTFKVRWR